MREGMRKWLTVRGYQIHKFPDVRRCDKLVSSFHKAGILDELPELT
jgi:hypothetical protein